MPRSACQPPVSDAILHPHPGPKQAQTEAVTMSRASRSYPGAGWDRKGLHSHAGWGDGALPEPKGGRLADSSGGCSFLLTLSQFPSWEAGGRTHSPPEGSNLVTPIFQHLRWNSTEDSSPPPSKEVRCPSSPWGEPQGAPLQEGTRSQNKSSRCPHWRKDRASE